jgi:F0F1-type ATP synthase assembly protein I
MPDENQGQALARSLRLLQENLKRAGPAMMSGYVLIAAILICGGGGYLLDAWLGTEPWLLVGGLLLGIAVGFVQLARIVWHP